MALDQFIPKIWSARLQDSLRRSLVFGAICNRNWEGDIRQYGDTVHIGAISDITVRPYTPNTDLAEPEQLDGTDLTLVIDHGAYYNFYVNDVNAAQARADIMDAAMRCAAARLAEDAETYLLGVIRAGAGTKQNGKLPAGGIWELLIGIKTKLDEKHVPKTGRKLIIPPSVESLLLMDNRFIVGTNAADGRLESGSVARAAGFDIYISPELQQEIIAMTPDSVTFANQIVKTEAYRREKGFDDGVKGLSLCGAKVVLPDAVLVHKLTA